MIAEESMQRYINSTAIAGGNG